MKKSKLKQSKIQKMLHQILVNQLNMMIWMSSMMRQKTKPYYEGYFAGNIAMTEELIE
jgi:ubiquitin-protein ligase